MGLYSQYVSVCGSFAGNSSLLASLFSRPPVFLKSTYKDLLHFCLTRVDRKTDPTVHQLCVFFSWSHTLLCVILQSSCVHKDGIPVGTWK